MPSNLIGSIDDDTCNAFVAWLTPIPTFASLPIPAAITVLNVVIYHLN